MRYNTKRGFTLIELLVVVLIIGILAAVALPQYQLAVMKSRYATLKQTARTLLEAEDAYYLANGQYTNAINNLDISVSSSAGTYCNIETYNSNQGVYVRCSNNYMRYQAYPSRLLVHDVCLFVTTNLTAQKVCQQETGKSTIKSDSETWSYINY